MSHIRTQIREAVINALSGQTVAGENVFDTRIDPYQTELPAIAVYTESERAGDIFTESIPIQRFIVCELVICAIISTLDDSYALVLDNLCQQIQTLIGWDLGGIIESCYYAGTDIFPIEDGDTPFAIASIKYDATYIWQETLPVPPVISNLNEVDIKFDMVNLTYTGEPGPDGQIDSEAIIEFTPRLDFSNPNNSQYWFLLFLV